ncbi:MAG TPA: HNH endonuclease [Gammaproteobacteria bacterium]|nr:HNH endonuclease [Gammaproteobacteria bacterium]
MKILKAERAAVFAKYDGRCAYCGEPLGDRWHVDHFEPVVRKLEWAPGGGVRTTSECYNPERHAMENLMPACAPCNMDKSSLNVETWRRKLEGACGVLRRNQPTYRHALRFGLVAENEARVIFHYEALNASLSRGHAEGVDVGLKR